jgi:hypothetical protein
MKRCAAILEWNPLSNKEEWRIINNPTIGDIHSLRNKGAIIMRQIIRRYGNEIHKDWVVDSGAIVTSRIDFLK